MFSSARLLSRATLNSLINRSSSSFRKSSSMASATITPYKIHISPDNTGLLGLKQTEDASKKVSELLQKDLEVKSVPNLSSVACANA